MNMSRSSSPDWFDEALFRIEPSGRVISTKFPGVAVPPVGENLMDMVPSFLRPQYEINHNYVLNHGPIRGLLHLARKDVKSLMWASCFKHAAEDGKSIAGNCVDVRHMRKSVPKGSPLDLACEYLEKHFDYPIRLDQVLEQAGVSRATLHRKFVNDLSISVVDYLTMIRIDHSMRLMRGRDPDLATLALESGFCDQSYFGKRFKEFTRMTPAQYLKHCEWEVE